MGESPAVRTRVLLVVDPDPGEPGLAEALRARGFEVETRASSPAGLELLNGAGADVAVWLLPLGGGELEAICAAVKESAWAPVLIVAGPGGSDASPGEAPAGPRPDAIVTRPVDAGKLAIEIHEHLRALDFTQEGDAPALGVTLPELLLELERRRATVVLEIRAGGLRTAIHLREGQPVFAEGGSIQETLGRMLVRKGELDQEQYAQVVQRLTEGIYRQESVRMGEVLIEMGLMTPPEVYDALSQQVREKIVACFRWERFAYELVETIEEDDDLGIFQCPPVGALILAGMRAHYGRERLQPWLGLLADGLPKLRRPASEVAERFQIGHGEQKLLHLLDGSRALHALPGASGLDEERCAALLAALSLCREVALADGAPEQGELPALRLPSPKPRRAAAPPPVPAPPAAKPRPGKPNDSLAALRRQMGRREPVAASDPRRVRLEAENAFNQGLRFYRESVLGGALREFRRAAQLLPEEPEYRMMEAWLAYRTSRGEEKVFAAERLRGCVKRTLEVNKSSSRAHSILGQLAHAEGDTDRATKHLRLAVRHDPDDADANRLLRILHMRAQKH